MLISYKENKKGIKQNEPELSPLVARPGFEPGTSGLWAPLISLQTKIYI